MENDLEVVRKLVVAGAKSLGIEESRAVATLERVLGKTKPKDNKTLFNELCAILGHSGSVLYTTGRANKLRIRLKTFSPEQIKTAAQNIAYDDFMMGDNPGGKKYGNIDYLLRNDEKLDEWLGERGTAAGTTDLTKVTF